MAAVNTLNYKQSLSWGGVAAEALTQYRAVALNFETKAVEYVAVAGDLADGVVLVNAASGEPVEVIISGIVPVKITTAGSIAKGDFLMSDANGGFIEATTGEIAIAQALQVPAANGDLILAKLIPATTIA